MNKLLHGGVAGLGATVPMTLAMKAMHALLPARERQPLPPRKITMNVAAEAGVKDEMGEEERTAATLVSHFGYGAAMGALYAPLAPKIPLPPALAGMGFGLAVWAGSYLGWLPASGIHPPATQDTARRNALMITAHLIWGASLGVLADGIGRGRLEREGLRHRPQTLGGRRGLETMADEKRSDEQEIGHDSTTAPGGNKERTGDPGRTPGSAEGDRQTVEENLRGKGKQG